MTSKDFHLRLLNWLPFEEAFRLFQLHGVDFIFKSTVLAHDSLHDSDKKSVLYSQYPDVDVYDCADESLKFMIIEKISRLQFNSQLKHFISFVSKCNSSQKSILKSRIPLLFSVYNVEQLPF